MGLLDRSFMSILTGAQRLVIKVSVCKVHTIVFCLMRRKKFVQLMKKKIFFISAVVRVTFAHVTVQSPRPV